MTEQMMRTPAAAQRYWYRAEQSRVRHRVRVAALWLVLPGAIIALFRGTQMWFGYPSSQTENAQNDPFLMQLVLYSIVPFVVATMVVLPTMAFRSLVRLGPLTLLLFILLVLSVLTSVNPMQSARGLAAPIVLALPMIFVVGQFGATTAFRWMRLFVAVALVINFVYLAVFPQYAIMSGSLSGSFRGMFQHKNLFGAWCGVAFVLLLPPDFDIRRWDRLIRLILCCFAVAGAVLSKSSTAILLVIMGGATLFVAGFLARIDHRGARGILFATAFIGGIVIVGGLGQLLVAEVAGQFGKDVTLSGRSEIWEALWPVALDKPWTGHGFAMFRQTSYLQQFVTSIAWGPRSTHNTYIEIVLNSGFPALFVWMAIIVAAVFRGVLLIDLRRPDYVALQKSLAVIVQVLLCSMSEAGQMLAPHPVWPVLVASLYSIAIADGTRRRIAFRPAAPARSPSDPIAA